MIPIPDKYRRILIIDDNRSIHEDFRKIFSPIIDSRTTLNLTEVELFGHQTRVIQPSRFEVDAADQGDTGVEMIKAAIEAGRPYAVAIIDMRMPPGWDGVRTAQEIRKVDSEVQMVICTAYSDYSWPKVFEMIGDEQGLNILSKPFEPAEALQLIDELTEKWMSIHFSMNEED